MLTNETTEGKENAKRNSVLAVGTSVLLLCPFCKGKEKHWQLNDSLFVYIDHEEKCIFSGEPGDPAFFNIKDVKDIKRWNTRPAR